MSKRLKRKKEREFEEFSEVRKAHGGAPYFMVGPAMILLVIFVFYPLVNLVYLSFFNLHFFFF